MTTPPSSAPGPTPTVAPAGGNTAQQAQTQQLVSTLVTVTRAMASFNTDLTRFVNQIKSSSKQAEDTLKQRTTIDKKDMVLKSTLLKDEADAVAQQRKLQNDQQRLNEKQRALDTYQFNLKSKYVSEIKKDLEFQQTKLKKQEQQLVASVTRIKKLRDKLEEAKYPAQRKQLEYELTKELKTHKNLGRGLDETTSRVTALSGAQGKQTIVAKMLSGAFRGLSSKASELASGFTAASAAMAAWGSAVTLSSTREVDTFGGMVQNWLGQLSSGVSRELYESIQAQTRNVKLVGGEETQQKVIKTGRDEFFKYTGSYDKAAEATASIVPGLQASGISARDLSGSIQNLVPQFAKLSQATGESVTEIARMSAEIMRENNTRSMLHGTLKIDRDQMLQRMVVRQQELALAGYSLEQAKEIQREEIRRKMGGTIRERAKDMAQMFAAIEMSIRQQQDPEKRAKMQGEYDIMKQNRSAAMYGQGKEATDAQARMNESQTRLAALIHEQNSAIQANTGYLNTQRVTQEETEKLLKSNMFTGASYQAPMKEPTPKHQGDLTTESMFDGFWGAGIKGFQMMWNAASNPLVIGLGALLIGLGASAVVTKGLTRVIARLNDTKAVGGGLSDLIPEDFERNKKHDKSGKGGSLPKDAPAKPSAPTTRRGKIVAGAKSVLASGAELFTAGAGVVAEKGKGALEAGKTVASTVPWKQAAAVGTAVTGAGIVAKLLGSYAIDPLVGLTGVGKDSKGSDLEVNKEQDDKNWERFSMLEKTQSGFLRGLETVAGFVGFDNLSREAEFTRIEKETAYLNNLRVTTAGAPLTKQPGSQPIGGQLAPPIQPIQQMVSPISPTINNPTAQFPQMVSAVAASTGGVMPMISDTRIPPFFPSTKEASNSGNSKTLEELGVVADIRTIVELLGKLNGTLETDAEIRRTMDDQIQMMMRKAGVEDRRPNRAYDQSRRHVGG